MREREREKIKKKKKKKVTHIPKICTRIEVSVTNLFFFVFSLLFCMSVLQLPLVTICSAVTVRNCERHEKEG